MACRTASENMQSLRDVQGTLSSCRQLSQRVQAHSKRHQADWDAVREEVASICARIEDSASQVRLLALLQRRDSESILHRK